MLENSTALKAIWMGIMIAAPIGPIAILCLRNTIQGGFGAGLSVGLGAVTADTLYAVIALTGMSYVASWLEQNSSVLQLIGGVFILLIALRLILNKPSNMGLSSKTSISSYFTTYIAVTLLTLANPLTIATVCALFMGCKLAPFNLISALVLAGLVGLGSLLWHLILMSIGKIMAHTLSSTTIRKLMISSNIVLLCLGLFMVMKALIKG